MSWKYVLSTYYGCLIKRRRCSAWKPITQQTTCKSATTSHTSSHHQWLYLSMWRIVANVIANFHPSSSSDSRGFLKNVRITPYKIYVQLASIILLLLLQLINHNNRRPEVPTSPTHSSETSFAWLNAGVHCQRGHEQMSYLNLAAVVCCYIHTYLTTYLTISTHFHGECMATATFMMHAIK